MLHWSMHDTRACIQYEGGLHYSEDFRDPYADANWWS